MGLQGWKLVLCVSLAVVGLGCGDDGDGGSDAGSDGQACSQPGFTETGCICSAEQPPGSRHCGDDMIWGACSCPPPRSMNACDPGQDVQCNPCPGEERGRLITCPDSGQFDCSCGGSDGGTGSNDRDAG